MISPLLTTKVHRPPLRPNLVVRSRLTRYLDQGLQAGHGFSLISAPAGFGKTTLIGAWLESVERPVAWLSLSDEDNDPVQFFAYLIAAFQRIEASIGQTVQEMLAAPQLSANPVAALINDLAAAGLPLLLVLDDYHLISAPSIHGAVAFLLEHQPPLLHVVISTREDPPLPLARSRVRGSVTEIRERDLRFTLDEATAFLHQTMNLPFPLRQVEALAARTEGWIAGLQLAALALQEEPENAEAFIAAFTGEDRYIVDYLVEEVFQRQPEAIRAFLRRTAILDRLTASLCDAVTGEPDSQPILERLEAANLFLVPLDHRREWYRYYQLFGECLRATLSREEQAQLHQRALGWHESHGYPGQAIHHALAYAALTGDFGDAERLIGLAAEATIHRGGLATLSNWLNALPDAHVRANWQLATCKGWASLLVGQVSQAEEYANAAEAHCPQTAGPEAGTLPLLRAYIALSKQDYGAVARLAVTALRLLDETQARWRVMALWVMAEAQERTRSITEAIESLREAARVGQALGNHVFPAVIEASLASALNEHGRRQEAIVACEKAIARYRTPIAAILFGRLALLEYEANRLDLARQHLEQCMAFSQQLAVSDLQVFAYGISAMLLGAQGDTAAALDALQKANRLGTQEGLSDNGWVTGLEVNLHLSQGDLQFAARWAESANFSLQSVPEYLRLEEDLAYARLLLAQGQLREAGRWLACLEDFARTHDLTRKRITIYCLQALLAERLGQRAAALNHLARAVQIAAPEAYSRAFLDEDQTLVALLPHVRQVAPAFVNRLLSGTQTPAAQPLIEPLSERELEVLRLIAEGLSNADIAGKLFITTGTVKRHIIHVYGKLDVHSRTQALLKARSLNLLPEP